MSRHFYQGGRCKACAEKRADRKARQTWTLVIWMLVFIMGLLAANVTSQINREQELRMQARFGFPIYQPQERK